MTFSENEAQRLIEILSDKAGIVHGTWHTATQKGDPVAALKKQLEEKEKQLSAEQEDVTAAKNRMRELSKELSAEKSKLANVETRLSSQLSSREQEIKAFQARMQASYQDHVAETQKLNAKIQSLQDQLEKGPNAQLARLQQENSILRDALNQATSQTESKQNAELAKLRQECAKLSKELGDKSDAQLADEQQRKALEAKVATVEKQLAQVQVSLRKMLWSTEELLCIDLLKHPFIQLDLAQIYLLPLTCLSEVQARSARTQAELEEKKGEAESLRARLAQEEVEQTRLRERISSIEALLEAGRSQQVQEDKVVSVVWEQSVPVHPAELEVCFLLGLELVEKLSEVEESRNTLQAECDQYRTVLAETEGMLKHLQKSVEEEEQVWRAKIAESEKHKTILHLNGEASGSVVPSGDHVYLPSSCEQERLEKEKKLSKDLGQAATKLQQLLKATQEQLTREKDTVRKLQDQLQEKDGTEELKEGTSV
uniref:Ribosome binding protein 1 n=1 Tax=Scleropages formosus TaxID=113540 RepID=A0A8C9UZ85_SCLFO